MAATCPTPSFALAWFQQCLLKGVTAILTFCSVVYFSLFTTPSHILLSILLLNLFLLLHTLFLPASLLPSPHRCLRSCGHARSFCLCHIYIPTVLPHLPPPRFLSSRISPFFPCLSYIFGIQWMDYCCVSCSLSLPLPLVISPSYIFLLLSTVSSLVLPTLLFSIFFHVFCFLPHSLCLSHAFLFLPWTSDYLSAFLSSSLLPTLGPSPPQAGAHTLPDLSTRQQSLPTASPLSRSNLCSLLYSAPSGMAVVSGKFSASSWMQPPPSSSSQLLLFSLLHRRHPWFHIHTAALAITTMVISMPSPTRKPPQAGQRAGQLLTVFSWRLTDKMIQHTVFKRQLLTQEVHQYPWKFSGWRDKQILNSAGKFSADMHFLFFCKWFDTSSQRLQIKRLWFEYAITAAFKCNSLHAQMSMVVCLCVYVWCNPSLYLYLSVLFLLPPQLQAAVVFFWHGCWFTSRPEKDYCLL